MLLRGGNYLLVVAGRYSLAQQMINTRFYKKNLVLLIYVTR
jgi:hypothetical protein